ncbi:MAG: hypothetical protein CL908_15400 [Deltaproteobacteria bacterium]|nr:hypothetical protein [Deltaproteobacteria bacterium]
MRRAIPSLILLLFIGGTGCGSGESDTAGSSAPAPTKSQPAAAQPSPTQQPADTAEPSSTTPSPGNAEAGAATYASFCASCHGSAGESDGPVASGLSPLPARHADGQYMNALSDEHLIKVVSLGGAAVGKSPLMSPWGGMLDEQQIRDVVAFVRTLAKPPYPAP